jgi:uncharacterized protein (TIGR03382 family)
VGAEDTTAPTFSDAIIEPAKFSGDCASQDLAKVNVIDLNDDLSEPNNDILLKVTITKDGGDGSVQQVFVNQRNPYIGRIATLGCPSNVRDAESGATYKATITAIDVAGNESASSRQIEFKFEHNSPPKSQSGCAAMHPPETAFWAVGFVFLAALRRRRTFR